MWEGESLRKESVLKLRLELTISVEGKYPEELDSGVIFDAKYSQQFSFR